jgi:hypothetical protein
MTNAMEEWRVNGENAMENEWRTQSIGCKAQDAKQDEECHGGVER